MGPSSPASHHYIFGKEVKKLIKLLDISVPMCIQPGDFPAAHRKHRCRPRDDGASQWEVRPGGPNIETAASTPKT